MTFIEIIFLALYLGSITFFTCSALFGVLAYTIKGTRGWRLIMWSSVQLVVSLALSIPLWFWWPFNFDVMFGFLFLPGLLTEIATAGCLLAIIKKKQLNDFNTNHTHNQENV